MTTVFSSHSLLFSGVKMTEADDLSMSFNGLRNSTVALTIGTGTCTFDENSVFVVEGDVVTHHGVERDKFTFKRPGVEHLTYDILKESMGKYHILLIALREQNDKKRELEADLKSVRVAINNISENIRRIS